MIEYRQLADHPGYRFGSDGSFWTRLERRYGRGEGVHYVCGTEWRQLQPTRKKNGYLVVQLAFHRGKQFRLHNLLLMAFVGPRPEGFLGRHLDDNKNNNAVSNLAWGTHKDNAEDCVRNGRRAKRIKVKNRGEKHANSRLTDEQREVIRTAPGPLKDLAARFGVSVSLIEKIRSGQRPRKAVD